MRILRTTLLGSTLLTTVLALSAAGVSGQSKPASPAMNHDMPMPPAGAAKPAALTTSQKITNAMAAGPSSISAAATILDWPAKDGEKPPVLRAGTNGWTCFPDFPGSPGNDPMCLDAAWVQWMQAYLEHKPATISSIGIGYMIAAGGGEASNSDPYAMKMTADNHWGLHGPHVMIAVPDLKSLDALPTDPANGGPYVMWKGTPYAHIMAPIASPKPAAKMGGK